MAKESYSPYKLSMYLNCPARYKFTYIDGLARKFETPKPYFTLGDNVHWALREIFRLPPEERSDQKLEYLLREAWKKNRKGFKSKDEEKEYGQQALLMLKNFSKQEDLKKEPLKLEEKHKIEIEPDLILQGVIDRIDLEEDGLHIIDYKTGKERNDKEDLQFIIYPLIVSRELEKKVSKISYFYLASSKYLTKTPNEKDLKEGLRKVLEIIEKIRGEGEFAPKVSNLCKEYCDFLMICPKRKEIAPERYKENLQESPF